jgi:hypothetical protein
VAVVQSGSGSGTCGSGKILLMRVVQQIVGALASAKSDWQMVKERVKDC